MGASEEEGGESSSRMIVMEIAWGCRIGPAGKSSSKFEPYWLKGMGWTLNFVGAEAGLVAE
jgi:hypothetical protein